MEVLAGDVRVWIGLGVALVATHVATLAWVYRDAKRRGMHAALVAVLVGVTLFPVGVLVWLAVRPDVEDAP